MNTNADRSGSADNMAVDDPASVFDNWPALRDLPALSAVASEVIQLTSAEPFEWEQCIRVLQSDAGLSAKLLKLVNSSYYGLRGSITSVERAARMLGEVTFRCLALGLAVAGSLPRPRLAPFDPDLYWRDNLMRALFAKEVSHACGVTFTSEVFSASLLQNMGIPLLAQMYGEDYKMVLERFELGREPFHELETLKYGWNHAIFGAWVAAKWRFPQAIVLSIRRHHDPIETGRVQVDQGEPERDDRLVRWTQLSALLPSTNVKQDSRWQRALAALESIRPDVSYHKVAERVDESFAALSSLFQEGDALAVNLAPRFDAAFRAG